MSSNLFQDVYKDLKPSSSIEGRDFQLLQKVYDRFYKEKTYHVPVDGEVARQDHIVAPFEYMEESSKQVQDDFGNLMILAEELDQDIRSTTFNIIERMQYLRNEINYWKLQQQAVDSDVIEFYEEFNPEIALPLSGEYTDLTAQLSSLSFAAAKGSTASASNRLPQYYYAFGHPFSTGVIANPIDELKKGNSVPIKGIALAADSNSIGLFRYFLNREFEIVNSLTPIDGANSIIWSQDTIETSKSLSIAGVLTFSFIRPTRISYLKLDIEDKGLITDIELVGEHNVVHIPGGSVEPLNLYISPMTVTQIKISLADKATIARLPYTISAYMLNTVDSNNIVDTYVYYRDSAAATLATKGDA
ncbi:hypothetical protein [Acinetobacter sp.]|uniref:hypothetical protein n=1 Tax=Acinetobacter sp. TaxID=472 RepID=UPI003D071040